MRSKERIADGLWYGSLSGLMNDRVDSDDFADFSKELSTVLDEYAKEFANYILRNEWLPLGGSWTKNDRRVRGSKSTEELFDQFLQEISIHQ